MRYCVSGRQPYSVMKRADEIKVNYNDKDRIMDFVEKIPDKTIILDVPGDESDWATWAMYDEKFDEFYIALHNLHRHKEFADHGIKWYWPYPITSYYELNMITKLNPGYLMIGPPLSFDIARVATQAYAPSSAIAIPLRMVCNNARPAYLPELGTLTENMCGQFVRPEDVPLYEQVRCFEFDNSDLKQEEVMLHVYKENQTWPGNLNLLIKNLNFNVDNRAIPDEFGKSRVACGQRCYSTSSCHLCHTALMFAEQVRKERDRLARETAIDNN